MINLSNLQPSPGSVKNRKRVGRGPGSGTGKTAGVGGKGQKGGSGYKSRAWSEGGQMPIQRRLPKRGFTNHMRVNYQEVNIGDLTRLDAAEIGLAQLKAGGLLNRKTMPVKILGNGQIEKPMTVWAHAFSASAKEKIEKAGGKAEIIKKNSAQAGGQEKSTGK